MMASSVPEVEGQKVTVIDAKNGSSVPKIASFVEQLRQTTGVDVTQVMNNIAGNTNDSRGMGHLPSLKNRIPPKRES
jgi:flotillin